MLRSLIPWALAGLAGYFVPGWFHLSEKWQKVLVAALAGAAVGWLQRYL